VQRRVLMRGNVFNFVLQTSLLHLLKMKTKIAQGTSERILYCMSVRGHDSLDVGRAKAQRRMHGR
jgi:hypothetical protein